MKLETKAHIFDSCCSLILGLLIMLPAFWLGTEPPLLVEWQQVHTNLFATLTIPVVLVWLAILLGIRKIMCIIRYKYFGDCDE